MTLTGLSSTLSLSVDGGRTRYGCAGNRKAFASSSMPVLKIDSDEPKWLYRTYSTAWLFSMYGRTLRNMSRHPTPAGFGTRNTLSRSGTRATSSQKSLWRASAVMGQVLDARPS